MAVKVSPALGFWAVLLKGTNSLLWSMVQIQSESSWLLSQQQWLYIYLFMLLHSFFLLLHWADLQTISSGSLQIGVWGSLSSWVSIGMWTFLRIRFQTPSLCICWSTWEHYTQIPPFQKTSRFSSPSCLTLLAALGRLQSLHTLHSIESCFYSFCFPQYFIVWKLHTMCLNIFIHPWILPLPPSQPSHLTSRLLFFFFLYPVQFVLPS